MRSLSRVAALFIVGSGIAFPFPATANDSFAEVGAGGIRFVKETRIIMEREDLVISRDRVEVTYRFRNPTKSKVKATMAFPVPEYEYNPEYGTPQFRDFSLEIQGKPRRYEKVAQAMFQGRDVTAMIRAAGLPIDDLVAINGEGTPGLAEAMSAAARAKLVAEGLLTEEGDYGWCPQWSVSVVYTWNQEFPPNGTVEIHHSYAPVSGSDYFYPGNKECRWDWRLWGNAGYSCISESSADLGGVPSSVCMAFPADLKTELDKTSPDLATFRYWVSYILTTGANWSGPIREFNLQIKPEPGDFSVVCSDLPTPRAIRGNLEVRKSNYTPTQELLVYFLPTGRATEGRH